MESLTAKFGMGLGVPSPPWLPTKYVIDRAEGSSFQKQAARAISTGQLNASQRLHTQPIDEVVYLGPSGDCSREKLS